MPKGSNQKLKLSYLCTIMQEKTDDLREGKELFKNFDMGEYVVENFSMFHGGKRRVLILRGEFYE